MQAAGRARQDGRQAFGLHLGWTEAVGDESLRVSVHLEVDLRSGTPWESHKELRGSWHASNRLSRGPPAR